MRFELVIAATAVVATYAPPTFAQACCIGSSAVFPARLGDTENALVGVAAKTGLVTGSFDSSSAFHAQPAGATELDLAQTLFVTGRALDRVQITVAVPWVETYRAAPYASGAGGGIGDASFGLRWDAVRADASHRPGVAPLASLTVPSGTAADAAKDELATEATGVGATQLAMGLALEEMFGATVVTLTTTGTFYGSRTTHGITSRLGPELDVSLATTHALSKRWALGALATFGVSSSAWVGGAPAVDSAHQSFLVAASAAVSLATDVRLIGALFFTPPISGIARNESATVGLTLTLVYTLVHADCACGTCHRLDGT